ncbi:MAG: hypothetical protein MJ215_06325 [Spirochaetia bacterium]|nr:hypothetical protein [Spirochaetia bacterium]
MRRKFLLIASSLLLVLLVIGLSGCTLTVDSGHHSYTVWTDACSYWDFQMESGRHLFDGECASVRFSESEFNAFRHFLTQDGRHRWSEVQIYDWLAWRGLGMYEARNAADWLTDINHGFIAVRDGSVVYMILK